MLRITFRLNRDDVTRDWKKFKNEKLVIFTPHIIKVIKSRRMKWAGHVACMRGDEKC
jgi:hypothetical protein